MTLYAAAGADPDLLCETHAEIARYSVEAQIEAPRRLVRGTQGTTNHELLTFSFGEGK